MLSRSRYFVGVSFILGTNSWVWCFVSVMIFCIVFTKCVNRIGRPLILFRFSIFLFSKAVVNASFPFVRYSICWRRYVNAAHSKQMLRSSLNTFKDRALHLNEQIIMYIGLRATISSLFEITEISWWKHIARNLFSNEIQLCLCKRGVVVCALILWFYYRSL